MFSSPPDNLEIKGNLQKKPFAELLREMTEAKLSGSFRLAQETNKIIVYLRKGEVVFAVSNLRQHRLFEILLQNGKISESVLADISDFTNDFTLNEALLAKNVIFKDESTLVFSNQIRNILQTVLNWETGDWVFSPLARIKETIHFEIDWLNLLTEYARSISITDISKRFKSFEENFGLDLINTPQTNILPQEAFILSRFGNSLMSVQDIKNLSGLTEDETLKILYVLWLSGFLIRRNWNSALSEDKIKDILTARLSLVNQPAPIRIKKEVKPIQESPAPDGSLLPDNTPPISASEEKRTVEEYLNHIENSESYYQMFNVPVKATTSEIKNAYFNLAKNYHPDRYHQEANSKLQQRIQDAFTEIARAYETLKDESKRETYDYRLRKYLEDTKTTEKVNVSQTTNKLPANIADKAGEEFEQGFNLVMNENYAQAVPFLTRAVQMAPGNAKYHAYFGKALAADDRQRHKAESEIQAAIKLDPGNTSYRIMLVELYIQFKLLRRAEGELQRFLAQFPNNREAMAILGKLPKH